MKINLRGFILLFLIFLFSACTSASNNFIPGVTLDQDVNNHFNWEVPLTVSFASSISRAELVNNYGPRGEEALRLYISNNNPFVVSVRYFPNLEAGFRYRLSVDYKANYETKSEDGIGAFLTLFSHKKLNDVTYIPLKKSNKWNNIEVEFDVLNASKGSPFRIYFSLGSMDPDLVLSSGEICFINLKIVKVED